MDQPILQYVEGGVGKAWDVDRVTYERECPYICIPDQPTARL